MKKILKTLHIFTEHFLGEQYGYILIFILQQQQTKMFQAQGENWHAWPILYTNFVHKCI